MLDELQTTDLPPTLKTVSTSHSNEFLIEENDVKKSSKDRTGRQYLRVRFDKETEWPSMLT